MEMFDVVIIGGGPAGITAGIYAKSWGLSCAIIEKGKIGGQLHQTTEILNYPGFDNITGAELSKKLESQAKKWKIDIINDEVVNTKLDGKIKIIKLKSSEIKSKTVIITTGTEVRTLEVDNAKKLLGKGVSYSVVADKDKYVGKDVVVIGGGNSALEDALSLAQTCKKVFLVHRREEFRGDISLVNRIKKRENIECILPFVPFAIVGKDKTESIVLKNAISGDKKELKLDCVFVSIGRDSSNDFMDSAVIRNESGFIVGNDKMETNIAGVFVAGDARNTYLRQIVCATSDGAIASLSALNYLRKIK